MSRVPSWLVLLVLAVVASACVPRGRDTTPKSNSMYVLDLNGHVEITESGEVRLQLTDGRCTRYHDVPHPSGGVRTTSDPCVPFENEDWRTLTVLTPWGETILASSGGPYWAAFRVDWSKAAIDPLGKDADAQAAKPWKLDSPHAADPVFWEPDQDARATILVMIGQATGVEVTVGEASAPARLEVTELRFSAEVHEGAGADLIVTVKNVGDGDAYRVVATTRSSVPALHNHRLGFGRIGSGASKTRRLHVEIPRDNDEDDATLVLSFAEAHNFTPAPVTLRTKIAAASDVALITLTCAVDGHRGTRVTVDAGQSLQLSCEVAAAAARGKNVRVQAQVAGGPAISGGPAFDLEAGGQKTLAIPLVVPQGASMDSELVVAVSARDDLGAFARASVTLVVARPNICAEGKLTRDAYVKKRAELRRALEAKVITREEYEKYDSELVGCMEAD